MNDHHDLARIAYIVENYEKIKEVAESNDMQQNRNRVKDISNE